MKINKDQAEAILEAILAPDLKAQDDYRKKIQADKAKVAEQKRSVRFALIGCAVGAVVGYFIFGHLFYSGAAGGLLGAVVSRTYKSPTA